MKSRAHLLVIDDNADMRLTLKLALELEGYSVDVARNGKEALMLQRKQAADVVITDIFMPESDGFEVIDGLLRQFPAVKIVAITGGAQRSKRDYLRDAEMVGVDATLQKPFDMATLLATLRSLAP